MEDDFIRAEMWSKLKTIRDDKLIPSIYCKWCDQVMKYIVSLKHDE